MTAYPSSLIQTCLTFRPGNASAFVAGLGGKSLVHFLEYCAMLNSLVRKHIPEGRPTSIINGLRHVGLGESCCINVANSYVVKLPNDARRELMVKIAPGVRDFAMNFGGLPPLFRSLGNSQFFSKLKKMPWIVNFFSTGQRGEFLKAKIDSDTVRYISSRSFCYFNNNVEIPVPTRILGKITSILNLPLWKLTGIKNPIRLSVKTERITCLPDVCCLDRNPSEGLLTPIAQVWPPLDVPTFCVLLTYSVNGMRVKPQLFTAACGEVTQLEPAKPLLPPFESVLLCVIAEVPDVVNRSGLLVQLTIKGFHAITISQDHIAKFTPKDQP